MGEYKIEKKRNYIHAAADRFDEFTDVIRAVRSKDFKYIRNYRPEQGYYLPVSYREHIPSMSELLELHKKGKLNKEQALWFRDKKDKEELYNCETDPHELHNLASNPDYSKIMVALSNEMDRWITDIGDQPNLPEIKLIHQLWKGSIQPTTSEPIICIKNKLIEISCKTEAASIGYKLIKEEMPLSWSIYTQPFEISEGEKIIVNAHRIGFKPSKTIEFTAY